MFNSSTKNPQPPTTHAESSLSQSKFVHSFIARLVIVSRHQLTFHFKNETKVLVCSTVSKIFFDVMSYIDDFDEK